MHSFEIFGMVIIVIALTLELIPVFYALTWTDMQHAPPSSFVLLPLVLYAIGCYHLRRIAPFNYFIFIALILIEIVSWIIIRNKRFKWRKVINSRN